MGLIVVGLSAGGNLVTVHDAGRVGITVDKTGQPVIVVLTCDTATPLIDLSEGRKPSDPDTKENVHRGNWQARKGFAGVRMLAVAKPSDEWSTTKDPGKLESDRLFIVDGGTAEDKDASLHAVSFTTQDLARLSPTQVRVDEKIEPLSTFGTYRCQK